MIPIYSRAMQEEEFVNEHFGLFSNKKSRKRKSRDAIIGLVTAVVIALIILLLVWLYFANKKGGLPGNAAAASKI